MNMLCSVDWERLVRVLSASLVPLIGIVTTYIAWQQHKTNKNQFRLALFDRRLKVFDSTGELTAIVLRQGRVGADDLVKFLRETSESEFLFGSDIAAYLHELYEKASVVHALEDAVDAESRQKMREVLVWFSGQGDAMKTKFGKYMAFRESS